VREIERIVDAVDAFLADRVHGHPAAPGPRAGRVPLGRVEFLRERSALRRVRGELRRTTAGLLFLRNKLEAEQTERRVRMARACHALLRAAREDDDATALPLLSHRDRLRASIRRAEQELAGVRTQAAFAKAALARLARAEHRLESQRAAHRRRAPRRAPIR